MSTERNRFIRPSSLYAIAGCEARPLMEATAVALIGEPPAQTEANLGHDLHGLSQQVVDAVTKDGHDWGEAISYACNGATLNGIDSWSVWCLQFALEQVRDLIVKHGITPENVLTEHRLDMDALGFPQGGTADVVLVDPGRLVIVVDYKFGYVDQGDADAHDQLAAYAAAAAETFVADRVEAWLIQPRAEKEHRTSGAKFDAATLRANRAWTAAVIRLAQQPNPNLTAGYAQCQHCRALAVCPEARRKIMEAKEALAVMGAPIDADSAGELADAAKLAEKFADAGKTLVKSRLMEGGKATGWKLGTPRAIRTVADPGGAIVALEGAGYTVERLASLEALTLKVGALPPDAAEAIAHHVTEKLSDPPLTQDKRKG